MRLLTLSLNPINCHYFLSDQTSLQRDKIKIIAAIALLKGAQPLPANKGGAIKEKIKESLAILTNLLSKNKINKLLI